jgi:hypothetical protein
MTAPDRLSNDPASEQRLIRFVFLLFCCSLLLCGGWCGWRYGDALLPLFDRLEIPPNPLTVRVDLPGFGQPVQFTPEIWCRLGGVLLGLLAAVILFKTLGTLLRRAGLLPGAVPPETTAPPAVPAGAAPLASAGEPQFHELPGEKRPPDIEPLSSPDLKALQKTLRELLLILNELIRSGGKFTSRYLLDNQGFSLTLECSAAFLEQQLRERKFPGLEIDFTPAAQAVWYGKRELWPWLMSCRDRTGGGTAVTFRPHPMVTRVFFALAILTVGIGLFWSALLGFLGFALFVCLLLASLNEPQTAREEFSRFLRQLEQEFRRTGANRPFPADPPPSS